MVEAIISSLKKAVKSPLLVLAFLAPRTRRSHRAQSGTGEAYLPAMRVPKFRASKGLKDAVKE